jgi:uncharacterized protein YceK
MTSSTITVPAKATIKRPVLALAVALCSALGGCGSKVEGESESVGQSATEVQTATETQTDDGWVVKSQVDPMTDQASHRATALLKGERLDAQLAITCNNQEMLYTFAAFDKTGVPTAVNRRMVWTRIDKSPPFAMATYGHAANQVVLYIKESKYPLASKLAAQIAYAGDQQTFQIDQTDSALRPMLDQCAKTLQANEELKAQRQQAAAARRAACGNVACEMPDDTSFTPLDIPGLVTEAPPPAEPDRDGEAR